jgi:aromatic-L-amino-acid decarboxylase
VAANWLATAWDQNAVFRWTSPIAATLEDVCLEWFGQLFQLAKGFGGAFVIGATMASTVALAAARHATMLKAVSLLGLGRSRIVRAPADAQGRMQPAALPRLDERTLICIRAGNVNTGSFDPAAEICRAAHATGARVHVDGAFGLWALTNPGTAAAAAGVPEADSWATTDADVESSLAAMEEAARCSHHEDLP